MGGRLKGKVGQKGEEITKGLGPVRKFLMRLGEPLLTGERGWGVATRLSIK